MKKKRDTYRHVIMVQLGAGLFVQPPVRVELVGVRSPDALVAHHGARFYQGQFISLQSFTTFMFHPQCNYRGRNEKKTY
jgi:hypothetical protein